MHRLLVLALLAPAAALAVPLELAHQGRIFDGTGVPLDGTHDVEVSLYAAPSGGSPLWTEAQAASFDNGFFAVTLGRSTALDPDALDVDGLWLGMSVGDDPEMSPRVPLGSVPFALQAHGVSGGRVSASEIVVNGVSVVDADGNVSWDRITGAPADALSALGCSDGQIPRFDTTWGCVDASDHAHDLADLDGVLSLSQIPVGTDADSVAAGQHTHAPGDLTGVLSVDQLPVGDTGTQVARGDHTHTAAQVGALPDTGGALSGALTGTDATFSGTVSGDFEGTFAGEVTGTVASGSVTGRICPPGQYLSMGYCLPKGEIEEQTECESGTLVRGVCYQWPNPQCQVQPLRDAHDTCTELGARLCTVGEMDRLDGVGCGGDYSRAWANLAPAYDREAIHGLCIRRQGGWLDESGGTPHQLDTDDDIASCDAVERISPSTPSPQTGLTLCCFD